MSEMSDWIECDDPERLAAAAAAGVRVEVVFDGADCATAAVTTSEFAARIEMGHRFRFPARVVWPPALTVPEGDWEWTHPVPGEPHPPHPDLSQWYVQGGTRQIEAPCLHPGCGMVVVALGSAGCPPPGPLALTVPEGMTPERLRAMAMDAEVHGRHALSGWLTSWADDLAAQIEGGGADDREASGSDAGEQPPPEAPTQDTPALPDDPFPVGCRVRHGNYGDDPLDGVVVGRRPGTYGVSVLFDGDDDAVWAQSYYLTRIDSEPSPADPFPVGCRVRHNRTGETGTVVPIRAVRVRWDGDDEIPMDPAVLTLIDPEPVVTAEEVEYLRSPGRLKNMHRTPAPESSPDGEGEDDDEVFVVKRWRWDALRAELAGALAERDALAARLAAWPEVPDGHEVLVVERDAVDGWANRFGMNVAINAVIHDAARAAVDRRPQPEPRVERVPWGSHLRGRFVPHEPEPITRLWNTDGIERYGGEHWEASVCSGPVGIPCDGLVEVLAEDGES